MTKHNNNKKFGGALKNLLKQNQRALKVSGARMAGGLMRGDTDIVEREIQSRVDRASAKKAKGGVARGRGAYGRGAYAHGRGAYTSTAGPVAVNSLFTESSARRHQTTSMPDETGRVTVSRREYVTRVISPPTPGDFTVTSYNVNPGLSGVFAWLSQVAANYDEYELRHLVFHYKPVISMASTSGAMGSVVLACNYNAGAPKFKSFREMVEYEGAMETRICDQAYFGIECDPSKHSSQSVEFIRTGSVPDGQDIKTYDLGKFQVATSDISASDYPAGTLLGHLYVEYDVVLGKPKLYTALGKGVFSDMFRSSSSTAALVTNNYLRASANNIGCVLTEATSEVVRIVFPDNFQATILINVFIDATTPAVIGQNASGEVTPLAISGRGGSSSLETTFGSGSSCLTSLFTVTESLVADGNYVNFDMRASTGISGFNIVITQVSPDFENLWVAP